MLDLKLLRRNISDFEESLRMKEWLVHTHKKALKNNEVNINCRKKENLYKKGNRITVYCVTQMLDVTRG